MRDRPGLTSAFTAYTDRNASASVGADSLCCPAPLPDRPPLPVAAFGVYASPLRQGITMNQPQRFTRDDLGKIVLANINEFGWHCVNVVEDDDHPPWSILRLAGPFVHPCTRPAPAAQRRDSGPPHGLRPLAHPWAEAST